MGYKINYFSPEHQHNWTHKYEEENNISMEIDFNGEHIRINFGQYGDNKKPSIHIIGPINLIVDHHSCNALDIYMPERNKTNPPN
jgi:hypothetical protein